MLELYHHGSSVCSAKVRLVLAEKELSWHSHYLDILAGEHHTPEYLALNPKAVVPTLIHDGQVIRESTVICEYIDDVFPEPKLKPSNPVACAFMRLWTKLVDEEVHPSVRPVTYVATHRHTILKRSPEEVEEHIARDPDPVWRERKRGWIYKGFDAMDVQIAIRFFDKLLGEMEETLADS
ncbi:MAG: glutathione S-transferase family protein, partial [Methyloligellaceae bacterium]